MNSLLQQILKPEYGEFLVDANDCLNEVVVVDTTDEVREEVLSDLIINRSEEELEEVHHAGAEVSPAQVLEDEI